MIETATIITLCMLYLIFFRPGKTPPLENPLVIERAGQFHATLAPRLNLAQAYIEEIAKQLGASGATTHSSATQFFAVQDKQVTAHGYDYYLLAVTLCNGMLYFQAASPSSKDDSSQLQVIREFSDTVLSRFPATGEYDVGLDEGVLAVVKEAALLRGIEIRLLAEESKT